LGLPAPKPKILHQLKDAKAQSLLSSLRRQSISFTPFNITKDFLLRQSTNIRAQPPDQAPKERVGVDSSELLEKLQYFSQ